MARIDFVTGNAQLYVPDVEALAAIPDRVQALLAGHSNADLREAPTEGEWSAMRILQHMTFYAREHHHNLFRMAWQADPLLSQWDEAEYIHREGWNLLDGSALLQALTDALAETVELLKDLPDASWGRAGLHHRGGRRSIRQQVKRSAEHHHEHLEQLERALGRSTGD